MKSLFLIFTWLLSSLVSAEVCFPESSLEYSIHDKSAGTINEFHANQLIQHFENVYSPLIMSLTGKVMTVKLDWENPKVNASATRSMQDDPIVIIFGGMIRHPDMTRDGVMAVLCHELGHFMGGAPKKKRGTSHKRSWSSAEGQADYFVGAKCLPFLLKQRIDSRPLSGNEGEVEEVVARCGKDEICQRTLLAGLSITKVFATLKNYYEMPSFHKFDKTEVWETIFGHPEPQCRLDTILAGLTCSDSPLKPFDALDPLSSSCYNKDGSRPRCWFSPESY